MTEKFPFITHDSEIPLHWLFSKPVYELIGIGGDGVGVPWLNQNSFIPTMQISREESKNKNLTSSVWDHCLEEISLSKGPSKAFRVYASEL